MEKSKVVRIILSILISVGLWVYVINVVNPSSTTVIRNIPVTLQQTEALAEKGLAIVGSGEYTVDVSVTAPRTDLPVLSPDVFTATADVSGLTMGQDYITVEVTGPRGYTINEVRSRKIQVYVDELASVTVPVGVETTAASAGYEATVISVYPETVEIKGAKQLVDSIDHFAVSINTKGELALEEITELTKSGECHNASGAILAGLMISEENILVKATIYPTKTVSLKVDYGGSIWKGARASSITMPTALVVKGSAAELAKLSELTTKAINIEGIYEDFEESIEVKLPKGVYLSNENPDPKFVVDIADEGSISFEYYTNAIATTNLPGELSVSYSLENSTVITATVTGPVGALKTMASSDITLSVEGGNFEMGTKRVKPVAATKVSGVTITLSPADVVATIRKR